MKELLIKAKAENLDVVLAFIEGELEAADCPMKLATQIAMATEEVFINIANYAYNANIGDCTIRIWVGDEVAIEFEDCGTPYNPLLKEDPDITASVDEREVGGLGIFMVKNIMDAVEYRFEGGKNLLTVRKALE